MGVKRARLESRGKGSMSAGKPTVKGLHKIKADYAYVNQPAEYCLS